MSSRISALLRNFCDTNLTPRSERMSTARHATEEIRALLHSKSYLSIDRTVPLGSYAKKTSISPKMDLDLHVFLNDQMPPFTRAKIEIARVLEGRVRNLKIITHGLTFTIHGLPVDLILTSNFRNEYISSGSSNTAQNQTDNVLYYLRREAGTHVNRKTDFSTSLSEGAVAFERRHSAFSHSMSRLAKFWATFVKLPAGRSLKGKSSIMEYLGVRAAEEEECNGSQDLAQAFLKFLNMVAYPDDLCIHWTHSYSAGEITAKIMNERPLLLDPSNPHDNFLGGGEARNLKEMSGQAKNTIGKLNHKISSGATRLRGLFGQGKKRRVRKRRAKKTLVI